ncbi:hypothetical protein ACFWVT_20260 [Streptomyces cyaneofuscatus]|uniref:hypothetical protein n=1 Tax=Streptomyces cyaneofuscatus TaxID=66883 RepID=UPI00365AD067
MRDLEYVAAVTATTGGGGALWLGGIAVPHRRLVLRWLRRQALRLADGHGRDLPPASPWLRARGVRQITFHGSDAPEGLRAWAGDEGRQDEALGALESGRPTLLTVVDPAVGLRLTLAGWPVGPDRPLATPVPHKEPTTQGRDLTPCCSAPP